MRFATTFFPPRTRLPLHARPVSYLSLVLTGSYVERVANETIECTALSLRFHPAGEEHAHVFGQWGSECFNLELDEFWGESVRWLAAARRAVHVPSAGGLGLQLIERCRRRDLQDCAWAESFAADLLSQCEAQRGFEYATESSKCIRRATEMIDDNLGERLSLVRIAAAVGLHPTHFARSFRSATRLTVGDYIRKRRRERAEALLTQNPTLSISRIAAEAGYADHAHMTRTFKADIGVAPSAYRAALLPRSSDGYSFNGGYSDCSAPN
jgi:AraC family transcriptional regulator